MKTFVKNNNVFLKFEKIILKKEIFDLLYFLTSSFYTSNYFFFKISISKISYKDLHIFLKNLENQEAFSFLLKNITKQSLSASLFYFLKSIFSKSMRFEFCIVSINDSSDDTNHCSLDILLCLKSFSFDTYSFVDSYVRWLFKDFKKLCTIHLILNLNDLNVLFGSITNNSVDMKLLFRNSILRSFNYSQYRFEQFFLYFFINSYIDYISVPNPFLIGCSYNKDPLLDLPSCLAPLEDKNSPLHIIHILSLYLTIKNAFLDINSNMIYVKKLSNTGLVSYLCNLDELEKNFLEILFFLKSFLQLDYTSNNNQFEDDPVPLISFFINSNVLKLVTPSFDFLKKNPLLLQRFFSFEFNIVEYSNGFYSFYDNHFYSFSFLNNYWPDNDLKKKTYVFSYNIQKKIFKRSFFLKHPLMSFLLKTNITVKKDFITFLGLFFDKTSSFSFYLLTLEESFIFKLINFLKHIYNNSSFIFYDLTVSSLDFANLNFSTKLPLIVLIDEKSHSVELLIEFFNKHSFKKPLNVLFLRKQSSALLSTFQKSLNVYLPVIHLKLENSFLYSLFSLIETNNNLLDSFIIFNLYFFKYKKLKSKTTFLDQLFIRSPYGL